MDASPGIGNRRQGGAMAIMAAVLIVAVVAVVALAVDLGRLAWIKRDMQRLADLTALDTSRLLCGAPPGDGAALQAAATASAGALGYPVDADRDLAAVAGIMSVDGTGLRRFGAAGITLDQATSVQVTLTRRNVPRTLFLGGFLEDNSPLTLRAVGVARNNGFAGISVGSFVLAVDTDRSAILNAVLGKMLGTSLDLTAVGYQGLVDGSVQLLDLLHAHSGVGTVDELLAADMSLGDFYLLMAEAVSGECVACAEVLQTLSESVVTDLQVRLGDVLQLDSPDQEAALDARLNLMDMVLQSAQVANGDNAVLTGGSVVLPGIGSVGMDLTLVQVPQSALGRAGTDAEDNWITQAHTAQVDLDLDLFVDLPAGVLLGATLDVPLRLEIAPATAWLADLGCPRGSNVDSRRYGNATLGVQTGVASLCITGAASGCTDRATVHANKASLATVSLLAGLTTVTVKASAWSQVGAASPAEVTLTGPFDTHSEPWREGTSVGDALSTAIASLVGDLQVVIAVDGPIPLGLDLSGLQAFVSALVGPLLGELVPTDAADTALDQLLAALGVTLGGADVRVFTLAGGSPVSPEPWPRPRLVE